MGFGVGDPQQAALGFCLAIADAYGLPVEYVEGVMGDSVVERRGLISADVQEEE